MEKSKNKLKVIITRGIVVLPSTTSILELGREKSINTVKNLKEGEEVIILSQKNAEVDDPKSEEVYSIGTIATIKKIKKTSDNDLEFTVKSSKRVQTSDLKYDDKNGYECEYEELKVKAGSASNNAEIVDSIIQIILEYSDIKHSKMVEELYEFTLKNNTSYTKIADFIANSLIISPIKKQYFLEASSTTEKLNMTFGFLVEYFDEDGTIKSSVDGQINKKMNDNIAKQQKEFYLRERLKTVKEELGELTSKEDEVDRVKKILNENPYPKLIREKVLSELNKYEAAMSSNESSITKSYIDWLLDLPWWQEGTDNTDLNIVEDILNKNHFGIEKVKERILEYLAVKTKNKESKGSILCLVGPPGVGKTSLASSIAQALNKEYVKVSLGGIKDESEIRGHRKTYIGAMPGRIIKAMKKAKVINPLFLLDEIDKMASDQRGDPASAMLEVLDPEQNSKFSDNYIEEDYDLSKVLFIATANYYKQIPHALIDRLEVIEISSYTAKEKKEIAKGHLVSKVFEEALIDTKKIKFEDEAIDFIIEHYTREAGVRDLERQIRKIARKYVVEELKGIKTPSKIDVTAVKKYLGKIIYDSNNKEDIAIPGIVNGMAYTSVGGDLLPIESSYSKGKGKVLITGNLEKTMNESVSVALGFVKANAKIFGIDEEIFGKIDIHIHVPSGGVPKDGPSAGVAITSAIISMLTNKAVKTNISMTGEITLRGKVGIIGGVKEKVISAHRAGVREIFLPFEDERFLEEVPSEILSDIKIHLVKQYIEVFKELF